MPTAVRNIADDNKFNAIYLTGALRHKTAIELVSGNNQIILNYKNNNEPYENKAEILNRTRPENMINLHGDKIQLELLINNLHPKRICLFQQDPKKLINVRNWIHNEFTFVQETLALYSNNKDEIKLK